MDVAVHIFVSIFEKLFKNMIKPQTDLDLRAVLPPVCFLLTRPEGAGGGELRVVSV